MNRGGGGGGKRRKVGGAGTKRKSSTVVDTDEGNEGGFLKQVQSRERSLMEQQRQRIERAAQGIDDSNTADDGEAAERRAKPNPTKRGVAPNIYKRRKAGGNIWKDVLNPNNEVAKPGSNGGAGTSTAGNDWSCAVTCGGCQGNDVEVQGNIVRRNNDVGKADIWGMARENDISTRYQCQTCGLKWNEAD